MKTLTILGIWMPLLFVAGSFVSLLLMAAALTCINTGLLADLQHALRWSCT